jgi:GNAT superfamily N-acetyltransferase
MEIRQATSNAEVAEARRLIEEYAAWLGVDLQFQGFAAELAGLPGVYAPPQGRLLLAFDKGDVAGCVALRPLSEGICEMKRMFVRPAFRGRGIGRLLAERIISEAREAGYYAMRLDTLPFIREALALYKSLGFVRCPAYYNTPLPETIFLELRL